MYIKRSIRWFKNMSPTKNNCSSFKVHPIHNLFLVIYLGQRCKISMSSLRFEGGNHIIQQEVVSTQRKYLSREKEGVQHIHYDGSFWFLTACLLVRSPTCHPLINRCPWVVRALTPGEITNVFVHPFAAPRPPRYAIPVSNLKDLLVSCVLFLEHLYMG